MWFKALINVPHCRNLDAERQNQAMCSPGTHNNWRYQNITKLDGKETNK